MRRQAAAVPDGHVEKIPQRLRILADDRLLALIHQIQSAGVRQNQVDLVADNGLLVIQPLWDYLDGADIVQHGTALPIAAACADSGSLHPAMISNTTATAEGAHAASTFCIG